MTNMTVTTHFGTTSAGAILRTRYAALRQRHTPDTNNTSIETTEQNTTNNTSIELPPEITSLITGSDFWVTAKTRRYRLLAREGHLDKLLYLAREAQKKECPANWFAVACSKANWETKTLPYFARLQAVMRTAAEVARRLGIQINRFILKQIWKGVNVVRWAVASAEVRHDKPGQSTEKYFARLCAHEHLLDRSVGDDIEKQR